MIFKGVIVCVIMVCLVGATSFTVKKITEKPADNEVITDNAVIM